MLAALITGPATYWVTHKTDAPTHVQPSGTPAKDVPTPSLEPPLTRPGSPEPSAALPKRKPAHVTPAPVTVAKNVCPGGICISGGTVTHPEVNNYGPPPAVYTSQEKPSG